MEMHTRQSLREVHGMDWPRRTRSHHPFWRALVGIGRYLIALPQAVASELAARRAISELSGMSDRMLRDVGINRGEIEGVVRRNQRAELFVGLGDERTTIVPARPEQQLISPVVEANRTPELLN